MFIDSWLAAQGDKYMERVKVLFFTKNTYIGVGYPPATEASSGNYKGAKVVATIGCSVTLVFVPSGENLDNINVYLSAADAYKLGQLLIDRAEVVSKEILEVELERGILKGKYNI